MFARAQRARLAGLWDELIGGSCKVESWSHDSESWSLVASRGHLVTGAKPVGLRARDVEIMEQALLCGVRKHVASDVGLSCSSIAVILQSCLQFMGLRCLPSRLPGLLVAAAHARRHLGKASSRPTLPARGCDREVIRVPRPDRSLAAWLAPAEHAVIDLLIEGHCYAEIAVARHTSIRTVANQVASGFRRLGVSGRAELLSLLARWSLEAPQAPARRPPLALQNHARRAVSLAGLAAPTPDVADRRAS